MKTLTTRDSEKIREHCLEREPFKTHGAMRGESVPISWGRLPAEYVQSFKGAEYAIYSYNTPIAWYGPDGWTFPDERYSPTTSKHQSALWFIHDWIESDWIERW
jgi:hypothetical protein